jgi:hypothetical protein
MNKIIQILLFLLPVFGISQTDTIAHLYTFGGLNNDNAEDIEATGDGGYIVVGSTASSSSGNTDIYLLKVDSLCNYQWSLALGGTNNDWGYSVKQTFDKGFIIAASTNSTITGGYDAVLYKRDSLGNYVWTKHYGGQDWDFAYDIVQTYDSGFVFCGETYNNTNGYSDVYVVKTNLLGDTLWTKTIGGALIDKGNAIMETSDSNIVIAGVRNTTTDSTQAYMIKLTPNGTLLWDSIYGDTLYENANTIIETSNGDYIIAGSTTSYSPAGDKDFYLLRTDKDGGTVWSNYFGNPSIPKDQEVFDLYEDINGDLVNVGFTEEAGGGMKDAYVFYITPGGWWGNLGLTFGSGNNETLHSFTIGNNGDFCTAGSSNSYGNGNDDVLLIRLDTVILNPDTTVTNYTDIAPLSIVKKNVKVGLNIYPNPTKGHINIEINEWENFLKYDFTLSDIQGRILYSQQLRNKISVINLGILEKGVYIYSITSEFEQLQYGEVIIIK